MTSCKKILSNCLCQTQMSSETKGRLKIGLKVFAISLAAGFGVAGVGVGMVGALHFLQPLFAILKSIPYISSIPTGLAWGMVGVGVPSGIGVAGLSVYGAVSSVKKCYINLKGKTHKDPAPPEGAPTSSKTEEETSHEDPAPPEVKDDLDTTNFASEDDNSDIEVDAKEEFEANEGKQTITGAIGTDK